MSQNGRGRLAHRWCAVVKRLCWLLGNHRSAVVDRRGRLRERDRLVKRVRINWRCCGPSLSETCCGAVVDEPCGGSDIRGIGGRQSSRIKLLVCPSARVINRRYNRLRCWGRSDLRCWNISKHTRSLTNVLGQRGGKRCRCRTGQIVVPCRTPAILLIDVHAPSVPLRHRSPTVRIDQVGRQVCGGVWVSAARNVVGSISAGRRNLQTVGRRRCDRRRIRVAVPRARWVAVSTTAGKHEHTAHQCNGGTGQKWRKRWLLVHRNFPVTRENESIRADVSNFARSDKIKVADPFE